MGRKKKEVKADLSYLYNDKWEENWKEVISNDRDHDGDFLITLVVHKLYLMIEYFTAKSEEIVEGSFTTDADVEAQLSSMIACYELGNKILTTNYGEEADRLFKEYGSFHWLSNPTKDVNYMKWKKLTDQAEKDRVKDIKQFFSMIGKNVNNWWI